MQDKIEGLQKKYWEVFHKYCSDFNAMANHALNAHATAAKAIFGDSWAWDASILRNLDDQAFIAARDTPGKNENQKFAIYHEQFQNSSVWQEAFKKAAFAPPLDELTPEEKKQKYWAEFHTHFAKNTPKGEHNQTKLIDAHNAAATVAFGKPWDPDAKISNLKEEAYNEAGRQGLVMDNEFNNSQWDTYHAVFESSPEWQKASNPAPSAPPLEELEISTSFDVLKKPAPKPTPKDENTDSLEKNVKPRESANVGSSSIDFLSKNSINILTRFFAPTSTPGYKFTTNTKDKDGKPCAILEPTKDNKEGKPIYIYKDHLHREINSSGKLTALEEKDLKRMADAVIKVKEASITPGLSDDQKKGMRTAWVGGSPAVVKFLTDYYASKNYTIVPQPAPIHSNTAKAADKNEDLELPSIRPRR